MQFQHDGAPPHCSRKVRQWLSENYPGRWIARGREAPVYSQNYWVYGLFPSSGILENTTVRKLDLFPFSGEGGGEDIY
jgi:hypothetical protein